jgi:hypothetical protein
MQPKKIENSESSVKPLRIARCVAMRFARRIGILPHNRDDPPMLDSEWETQLTRSRGEFLSTDVTPRVWGYLAGPFVGSFNAPIEAPRVLGLISGIFNSGLGWLSFLPLPQPEPTIMLADNTIPRALRIDRVMGGCLGEEFLIAVLAAAEGITLIGRHNPLWPQALACEP